MEKERAEMIKGLKAMPRRHLSLSKHLKAFLMITVVLGSRDAGPRARAWGFRIILLKPELL